MVDDHGHKSALIQPEIVLEEVLVDADFERPWVLVHTSSKFELLVQHAMQQGRGAVVGPPDGLEVAEVLAGPEQSPSVPLGGAIALANPIDGFGERTLAGAADETSLAHPDERRVVADRIVTEPDPAVVVDAARQGGAPRADFEGGRFLREQQNAALVAFSIFEQPEFRKKQVPR